MSKPFEITITGDSTTLDAWLGLAAHLNALTDRQARILRDRLNGHSWRTIANAYNITEATARGHHKAALANIERARKEPAA